MSRLDLILDLLVYEGAPSNDPQDVNKIKTRVQFDAVQDNWRLKESIAAATVDQNIALPDADTSLVIILVDQAISIKLNGSDDSLSLTPKKAGCKSLAFLQKGSITQLEISNSGTVAAKVDIFLFKL